MEEEELGADWLAGCGAPCLREGGGEDDRAKAGEEQLQSRRNLQRPRVDNPEKFTGMFVWLKLSTNI